MSYLGPHRISTIAILTLLCLSCNDQSQYYYPSEVGFVTGRPISQRHEIILDSTIAGVPSVVGSEWVYADSISMPFYRSHDTIRIRLAYVDSDSENGLRYIYQDFIRNNIDTFSLMVHGDTLFSVGNGLALGGFIWGYHILYVFPMTIGKIWDYLSTYGSVEKKERIIVEAGVFDTYVIRYRTLPFGYAFRWYAPGVGIIFISDENDRYYFRAELISYHIGPRRR